MSLRFTVRTRLRVQRRLTAFLSWTRSLPVAGILEVLCSPKGEQSKQNLRLCRFLLLPEMTIHP